MLFCYTLTKLKFMVTFIEVNKEIEKNGKFIVKYDG